MKISRVPRILIFVNRKPSVNDNTPCQSSVGCTGDIQIPHIGYARSVVIIEAIEIKSLFLSRSSRRVTQATENPGFSRKPRIGEFSLDGGYAGFNETPE